MVRFQGVGQPYTLKPHTIQLPFAWSRALCALAPHTNTHTRSLTHSLTHPLTYPPPLSLTPSLHAHSCGNGQHAEAAASSA
jgi:hypothetical protein